MRLLIITQKVDSKDPVLGFFHEWIKRISENFEFLEVICLEKGKYNLPDNTSIYSLGKESKKSKLKYILRFFQYAWQRRKKYDAVFIHMNQEYVLLGFLFWKLWNKKIYLWRNHAKGSWFTTLSVYFSNKVFCTSPQSYTAKFKKTELMPVGIDTSFFKKDSLVKKNPKSILFLGRIAPIKKVSEFIDWLKDGDFESATIVGSALPKDLKYQERVKDKVSAYGLTEKVKFIGSVEPHKVRDLMRSHETYVNFTEAGSMDKTILEAAACGLKLKVVNPALKQLEELDEKKRRDYVVKNHSLELLSKRLFENFTNKKILVVINNLNIGGAERLVVDQVNRLEEIGHCVHVITLLPNSNFGFSGNLKFNRGRLIEINSKSFLKKIWVIRKIIKEERYDIVFSHLFSANTLVRLAKISIFSRTKIITYEHNTYEKEKKLKHFFVDYVLSFFSFRIVAVSPMVKKFLKKKLIPERKIVLVENGISVNLDDSLDLSDKIYEELELEEGEILIVSSGNVNSQKGYEVLIQTAEILFNNKTKVKFVVCGLDKGDYALSLKKMILDKKLENNFKFLGPRLDVLHIVKSADIFVMSSWWEGLSISLLEAMFLGKVVFVSEIPSLTKLIENGYNGLTFKPGDSSQLAELIEDYISDFKKYSDYGKNAKLTASQYSIESNVEKLLSMIEENEK